MTSPLTADSKWVKAAFMVTQKEMTEEDRFRSSFTTALFDFTDTTPGGSFEINPPPQFTRSADPKVRTIYNMSRGKGRYYTEAIAANSQRVHFRMGVPQFNDLTTFFTGFYSTDASAIARTGRGTDIFYKAGRVATFVVTTMCWPILAMQFIGLAYRTLFQRPSSKFYYLKPTMSNYWNAVNTIVNQIAVYRGIVPRMGDNNEGNPINNVFKYNKAQLSGLHRLLPEIFRENGGIDVFSMASRAQRLAERRYKAQQKALGADTLDMSSAVQRIFSDTLTSGEKSAAELDYLTYLDRWLGNKASTPMPKGSDMADVELRYAMPKKDASGKSADPADPKTTDQNATTSSEAAFNSQAGGGSTGDSPTSMLEALAEFASAGLNDGTEFLTLRVDHTGPVSESFSNSYVESDLSSKLNGISGGARSSTFSFAGGNFGGGMIGEILTGVASSVKSILKGAATQLEISGIAALAGAAFVDIPKHWQNSTANLPRSNYTMRLISPYGDPISQLINLEIPLACILAMALPISTGKQSYTAPFLLEYYDPGRAQSRLAAIDSLSIRRGTSNLAFNNDNQCMAIDIDFSIIDMTSIMSMPIAEGNSIFKTAGYAIAGGVVAGPVGVAAGMLQGAADGWFDEDNAWTDYISTISGVTLADNVYTYNKMKLNLTKIFSNWESYKDPGRYTTFARDMVPVRLLSSFWKGTTR